MLEILQSQKEWYKTLREEIVNLHKQRTEYTDRKALNAARNTVGRIVPNFKVKRYNGYPTWMGHKKGASNGCNQISEEVVEKNLPATAKHLQEGLVATLNEVSN